MRRAAAPLCALVALAASGCETTQQLSAQIGHRLGHQSAVAGTTAAGARNRDVRVDATALIAGRPAAVAVKLTNESASAQTDVPVTLEVRDAKGASVYRNDTKGIEPSLQQIAALPGHATQETRREHAVIAADQHPSRHLRPGPQSRRFAHPGLRLAA